MNVRCRGMSRTVAELTAATDAALKTSITFFLPRAASSSPAAIVVILGLHCSPLFGGQS